jgi:hypothetical protein
MRIGFLTLLLFFTLHSCKQTKVDIRHPERNGGIILSIERTPCFGACPVYTATLYENGLLMYNGKRFTHSIGCHYAIISPSEIKKLRGWLEDDGIFLFKDKYPEEDVAPTDLSSCLLFYRKGKIEKAIVDRGWETPENLQNVENKIESWLSMQNLQFCDK